jgi:hypothetical protein
MSGDRRDIIAIPTYDRLPELIACLTCLREARGLDRYRIFIRDDASTKFGPDELAQLMPLAERIDRNAVNCGPDLNQVRLLRDCIAAGARRVIVLDSDMIVSPAALDFAERAFERTDGVLSLYNSQHHREVRGIDEELVEKRSIGGAATCWGAALLASVLDGLGTVRGAYDTWDWQAVYLLRAMRRRMIVSRRSYAQHLGISGQNNRRFGSIDYGSGFVIETNSQARFMAAVFDALLSHQHAFAPQLPEPAGAPANGHQPESNIGESQAMPAAASGPGVVVGAGDEVRVFLRPPLEG